MGSKLVVAIDGPSGAGKSTVARMLAHDLGLRYLDTGAMYRALALKATQVGFGLAEADDVAAIGASVRIDFVFGEPQRVLLDGTDVTEAIRTPEIGQLASELSTHPGIRATMVRRQRAIVEAGGVTLEGRDVTTVVATDADLKVYLTASLEERAERRRREFVDRGLDAGFDRVRFEMELRDHRDITRQDSPLRVAKDAHVIDSANMTPEQVVAAVKALLSELPPA